MMFPVAWSEDVTMPLEITWYDIALRLALTIIASAVLGINRTERGRAAGLRTTILVCLAASVSMIQCNLLLQTTGKSPESFAQFDVMRLPLGILTGIGFIGAGAILRRGEMIQGVTTAATIWIVTIIGLCLGGGQIGLGIAAVVLALIVLWALQGLESLIPQERQAKLTLSVAADAPSENEIREAVQSAGYRIAKWDISFDTRGDARRSTVRCEVRWDATLSDTQTPAFLNRFRQDPGVLAVRWSP
jgi:putative Mg2+ transporter-C (MgtC) family protein